jgi:hypothetical protein
MNADHASGLVPRLLTVLIFTLPAVAPAGTWTEKGDAGNVPAAAQITAGVGWLTAITGSVTTADPADLYQIYLPANADFSATTMGGVTFDSVLFLLNDQGLGVVANDDTSGFSAPSTIVASGLPAGFYFLGVEQCCLDPASSGGSIFEQSLWSTHNNLQGPVGPGGNLPMTGYMDMTGYGTYQNGGSYTIRLAGARFAAPEPTTLALVGVGLLGIGVGARKRTA